MAQIGEDKAMSQINIPTVTQASVTHVDPFLFQTGQYMHGHKIPYLLSTLTCEQLKNTVCLIDELPNASTINWKVEELFQRDVNWQKVMNQIKPYLTSTNRSPFFNAITIFLVPHRENRLCEYSDGDWNPPNHEEAFTHMTLSEDRHTAGPISFGFMDSGENVVGRIGMASWNKNEIAAVTIDGQHRLAAMKEISGDALNSQVPVIFVVCAEELGYVNPHNESVIDVMRKIFIDLNKNATPVSRTRQILLDDSDASSICVRSLIGEELKDGTEDLELNRLPITLVDWHTEQAKVDQGPYLTSVLGLDGYVKQLTGLKAISDSVAYDVWEKQIAKVDQLSNSDEMKNLVKRGNKQLAECRSRDTCFSLDMTEVQSKSFLDDSTSSTTKHSKDIISESFKNKYGKALTGLFSNIEPLKRVIDIREENETLTAQFTAWYQKRYAAGDDTTAAGLRARDKLKEVEDSIRATDSTAIVRFQETCEDVNQFKSEYPVPFLVVVHKAIFLAYKELLKNIKPDDLGLIGIRVNEDDRATYISESLVAALNAIWATDPCWFKKEHEVLDQDTAHLFWLCSLVDNQTLNINFTGVAANRISHYIFLATIFYWYQVATDSKGNLRQYTWDEVWEEDIDLSRSEFTRSKAGLSWKTWQQFHLMDNRSDCYEESETAIARLIAKNREVDHEGDRLDEYLTNEIRIRVEHLFGLVQRGVESS